MTMRPPSRAEINSLAVARAEWGTTAASAAATNTCLMCCDTGSHAFRSMYIYAGNKGVPSLNYACNIDERK